VPTDIKCTKGKKEDKATAAVADVAPKKSFGINYLIAID